MTSAVQSLKASLSVAASMSVSSNSKAQLAALLEILVFVGGFVMRATNQIE